MWRTRQRPTCFQAALVALLLMWVLPALQSRLPAQQESKTTPPRLIHRGGTRVHRRSPQSRAGRNGRS